MATPKPEQDSALDRNNAAFEHLRNGLAQRDTDNRRWIIGLFMAAIANLVILLSS